jgi:excisionase family DNA binding protein
MSADLGSITDEQIVAMVRAARLNGSDGQPSPWMTPEETSRYLGVALGTLRNWTSARYIPFARRGRVVRYRRETIDRWLAKGSCPGRTTLAMTM